jgi:hypothetical protein
LKICFDQTNGGITAQFVTKRLSTLQVLCHLKPITRGHHWLVRCSPSKWKFTDVEKVMYVLQIEEKPFNNMGSMVLSYELWQRCT